MEYKYYITSNRHLCHYGVKGMKWGVRRYQNKNGSLTTMGKERYRNTKSGMSQYAGMLSSKFESYKADTLREVVGSVSENGYFEWKSPLDNDILSTRFNQDYLDDPDSVFDKHASKVNKSHGDEVGTINNCTKTSAAMCLAKMGYDYDAGRCTEGRGRAFEYWFDDAEHTICDSVDSAIEEKFSKVSSGSFGTVDLRNINGGGHVFNWERNSRGEFNLYDSQPSVGEKYSGSTPGECFDKYVEKHPWFMSDSVVRVYDMTNAKPNFDHMSEDSVVRVTDNSGIVSAILDTNTHQIYNEL